jgi:hypothetical protein
VNYRPWLEEQALRQMGGIPDEALGTLARTMARICDDPYDRLLSMAVRDDDPSERMAELGDDGFIEFKVDEAARLVRVYSLVWLG